MATDGELAHLVAKDVVMPPKEVHTRRLTLLPAALVLVAMVAACTDTLTVPDVPDGSLTPSKAGKVGKKDKKKAVGEKVEFEIATTTADELSLAASFDGTNYFVAIERTPPSSPSGQLVSQKGRLVGPLVTVTGETTAGSPLAAFDGTNHLLIWKDDAVQPAPKNLHGQFINPDGQFISPAGIVVGSPSPCQITSLATDVHDIGSVAFGGGKYLVVYQTGFGSDLFGKIVSPAAADAKCDDLVGPKLVISSANASLSFQNSVAFDGANYFVVWADGVKNEVVGRFISTTGTLGTQITVAPSPAPTGGDPFLAVAFNGTNYLVAWSEVVGPAELDFDVFAQLVTPLAGLSGQRSGNVIPMSTAVGAQIFPAIATDGTNFFVTWWHDFGTDTSDTRGRFLFFDASGNPIIEPALTLFSPSADGRIPVVTTVQFNNGEYFAVVIRTKPGAPPSDLEAYTNFDVFGAFIRR